MKKMLNRIKEHILLCDLIFIVIIVILNFILNLLNIRFRLWITIVIIFLSVLGFAVGILQQIYKATESKKTAIVISVLIIAFIIILTLFFMPVIIFVGVFSYHPEHTVMLDGKRYVAVVSSFLHVDVNYYDYYGPLLMGTKVRVHGDFGKGGFDPFVSSNSSDKVEYTYYDNSGKIISKKMEIFIKDEKENIIDRQKIDKNQLEDFDKNANYILPKDEEVLYEKKFNKTILRFSKIDSILGQNMLVHVVKSKDGGNNFYVISDDAIQVSNDAKFVFLSETLGFAISTDQLSINNGKSGLFVTNDGGKTFMIANIEYENSKNDYITIQKEPYSENNLLKMKCSVYQLNDNRDGYEDKELTFFSKDNGLHWQLENEK